MIKKILVGTFLLITAAGCSSLNTFKKPSTPAGKQYVLVSEKESPAITISFAKENFYGSGGVNRYFGKYTASEGNIKFEHIGSTRMIGPKEDMEKEYKYFSDLSKADKYKIENGSLILTAPSGETLEYKEVPQKAVPNKK